MSESKFSYYQYQQKLGYEVYLRFEDMSLESDLRETLELVGFEKVDRDKIKGHAFNQKYVKVLKIVRASARVGRQISKADCHFDKKGSESISRMSSYDVYCFKDIGMMTLGSGSLLWELGIKKIDDQDALRTILTRYLSFALAPMGIVGFWGVPIAEGLVVMGAKESNREAIFIDLKKGVLLTYDGVRTVGADLQILRLDSVLKHEMKRMKSEELLGFLSMNTTYLSYRGLERKLKQSIFELTQISSGYIYPENNFKPRMDINEHLTS